MLAWHSRTEPYPWSHNSYSKAYAPLVSILLLLFEIYLPAGFDVPPPAGGAGPLPQGAAQPTVASGFTADSGEPAFLTTLVKILRIAAGVCLCPYLYAGHAGLLSRYTVVDAHTVLWAYSHHSSETVDPCLDWPKDPIELHVHFLAEHWGRRFYIWSSPIGLLRMTNMTGLVATQSEYSVDFATLNASGDIFKQCKKILGHIAGPSATGAGAPSQQATRHARRIYVGGLPPTSNEQNIATFFSAALAAVGGTTAGPGILCSFVIPPQSIWWRSHTVIDRTTLVAQATCSPSTQGCSNRHQWM